MKVPHRAPLVPVVLTCMLFLVSAGCSSTATSDDLVLLSDYDYASLSGTLNGSGSSFQDSLQQRVKGQFERVVPSVKVNYAKSGSSAGKADLAGNVVHFAGTDSLINDTDKVSFIGGEVLYFPVGGSPITLSYNLADVDELRLDADVIAGIFQAQITTWDDDAIKADNPDVKLPSEPIAVVHRSDGSGTTSNFTKYLVAAAPSTWKLASGDTVEWPTATQGAEKNSGVASIISSTEGAIGYLDLADSAVVPGMKRALIKNAAGEFVESKLQGASAALEGAAIADDLTFDPLNAAGVAAYPITSPTWMIVYAKQKDAATADALKGYLTYMLVDGQALAKSVGYAPLPEALQQQALAQLDKIVVDP